MEFNIFRLLCVLLVHYLIRYTCLFKYQVCITITYIVLYISYKRLLINTYPIFIIKKSQNEEYVFKILKFQSKYLLFCQATLQKLPL